MVLEDIGCLEILLVINAITGCLALKECGGCRMKVLECFTSNACVGDCIDGYWGKKCENVCNKGCSKGTCRQIDGGCTNGCEKGFTGIKCDTCESGLFGPSCQSCPTDCIACMSETNCTVCKKGFWGEKCQEVCSSGCSSSFCRKQSGQCEYHCKSGYWGRTCSSTCSPNCRQETCNYTTGSCDDGCKMNFYGDLCEIVCKSSCLPDVYGRRCFDTNGSCTQNCQDGFYGNTCKERCNKNCLGLKCSKNDGACEFGCTDGFEGDNCTQANKHIKVGAQETSNTSNIGAFVVIGAGAVAVTLSAVGIFTLIKRCIRSRSQRRNIHELQDTTEIHGAIELTSQNKSSQPVPDATRAGMSLYTVLQDRNDNSNVYSEMNIHPHSNMYINTSVNHVVVHRESNTSDLYSKIYDN